METVDVLVVGTGLAGLNTARLLALRGLDVLAVDRRTSLNVGIRTTGIFVRRTLEDFDLPAHLLGPGIREVLLYPPSRRTPVRLTSGRDEFRVADMAGVYAHALCAAREAGVRVRLGVRYAGGVAASGPGRSVRLEAAGGGFTVATRFTVGADGARSTVARDLGLDVNRRLIVGAELVYPIASTDRAPTFHCVLDPRLAPGYLGWVVDDGQHAHVGLAGYVDRMRPGLRQLLDDFARDAPGAPPPTGPAQRRGGPIPVGGVLRRLACRDGLLVGDAAGAVSPLTAGGLDPCLRLSELAADVTAEYLHSGDPAGLRRFDGAALRRRFRGRLLLRRLLAEIRSPAAAELALALLRGGGRGSPLTSAASRILFGDGSFPDTGTRPRLAPARAPSTG